MIIQRMVNWFCDRLIGNEDYKCPKCKGKGSYKEHHIDIVGFSGNVTWDTTERCEKCNGTGEVDWVEKVTGKNS